MIKDSGSRTEFETGAVRDIQKNKGRCDLMPLMEIGQFYCTISAENPSYQNCKCYGNPGQVLMDLGLWVLGKEKTPRKAISSLKLALEDFLEMIQESEEGKWETAAEMFLDVSLHYKEGAEKYGERNWEKGIPTHSYLDSAVRHLLKHVSGKNDERHDRAFVWNILGLMWTIQHKEELDDIN